jgi:hypothetical protein
MRSWAVPKGSALDPAVKRFALQVDDHSLAHNEFEGRASRGAVIVWDRGTYEQGRRVPSPEALERGHAVFVLHGSKLRGGFALQRTLGGEKPQWLLVKRRDAHARLGSDIVSGRPESASRARFAPSPPEETGVARETPPGWLHHRPVSAPPDAGRITHRRHGISPRFGMR